MLTFAIFFISVSLCLYTLSIWSEHVKKQLLTWMIIVFITAFSCDLVGTSLMFLQAETKFQLNPHTFLGYGALVFMGLHLLWALAAKKRKGLYAVRFHKWSIVAWLVWLAAFISGIPHA